MAPTRSLLLLPPAPPDISYKALNDTYGHSLTSCFTWLSKSGAVSFESAVLDIALPYRASVADHARPRSETFSDVQRLLATLYRLICIIYAKEGIPSAGPGSIESQIILLDSTKVLDIQDNSALSSTLGPVTDLPTLALSWQRWTRLFTPDNERGKAMLEGYSRLGQRVPGFHETGQQRHCVRGGSIPSIPVGEYPSTEQLKATRGSHVTVAVGGTFDHLHAGHKLLLTMTVFLLEPLDHARQPRRIIVGITGDELLKNKKYANHLGSWDERQEAVEDFIKAIVIPTSQSEKSSRRSVCPAEAPNGRQVCLPLEQNLILECVEISDPFGPTVTDKSVSALVVSGETRSGGQAINTRRREKGWPDVEVFEVDVLDAREGDAKKDAESVEESFAGKISSTEIRRQLSEQRK